MEYGNAAYILEQEDMIQRVNKSKENERIKARNKEISRKIKAMLSAIIVAGTAGLMISRQVEIDQTQAQIDSLTKQLTEAEALTYQKVFELERSVDLKKVEEIATTQLRMQRPEKYQIIYLNVQKEDSIEMTADRVEGFKNSVLSAKAKVEENILGIFEK